jgi:hypothetical protein
MAITSPKVLIQLEYGVHSRNFMTPTIIRYGWIKRGTIAYELSKGEGLERGSVIYGVSTTFLLEDRDGILPPKTRRGNYSEESNVFHSMEQAENFIKRLKEKFSV